MLLKECLQQRVRDDWGNRPEGSVCSKIIDYVASEEVAHLTLGSLLRVVGVVDETELLRAVQYLSGPRVHVLDIKFEFIEAEDTVFELSHEEINEARKTGILIHPETGRELTDFEDSVFIYFAPAQGIAERD